MIHRHASLPRLLLLVLLAFPPAFSFLGGRPATSIIRMTLSNPNLANNVKVKTTLKKTPQQQQQVLQAPPAIMPQPTTHTPAVRVSTTTTPESPFLCRLYDELGRPFARPASDGRSWMACLQPNIARQLVEDASKAQSVSRDLLTDALHLLEFESSFGAGKNNQQQQQIDGEWHLTFDSGISSSFLDAAKDRWGYLLKQQGGEKGASVRLHIDSGASAITVDALHGPSPKSFQGTFTRSGRGGKIFSLDFSRVQLLDNKPKTSRTEPMLPPSELSIINGFLRPGAKLDVIHVQEGNHLAVRYSPSSDDQESSLLVFHKGVVSSSSSSAAGKKAAATRTTTTTTKNAKQAKAVVKQNDAGLAHAKKLEAMQQQGEQGGKKLNIKFKKEKGKAEYNSMWEYFEEEALSLYLVLTFPAFMKHLPAFLHTAHYKVMLLQEITAKLLEGAQDFFLHP